MIMFMWFHCYFIQLRRVRVLVHSSFEIHAIIWSLLLYQQQQKQRKQHMSLSPKYKKRTHTHTLTQKFPNEAPHKTGEIKFYRVYI